MSDCVCDDKLKVYEKLDVDGLKLLHKHTYQRLMWYRAEIWRVAAPIWAGFGAFLIAVLSTAITLRKENMPWLGYTLMLGTFIISLLINVLFYIYVGRLYQSVDELNSMMTAREIALSKRLKLFQEVDGCMEKDHIYKQHRVFPTLDILFVLSNLIMTVAIIGIIYILIFWQPHPATANITETATTVKESVVAPADKVSGSKSTPHKGRIR